MSVRPSLVPLSENVKKLLYILELYTGSQPELHLSFPALLALARFLKVKGMLNYFFTSSRESYKLGINHYQLLRSEEMARDLRVLHNRGLISRSYSSSILMPAGIYRISDSGKQILRDILEEEKSLMHFKNVLSCSKCGRLKLVRFDDGIARLQCIEDEEEDKIPIRFDAELCFKEVKDLRRSDLFFINPKILMTFWIPMTEGAFIRFDKHALGLYESPVHFVDLQFFENEEGIVTSKSGIFVRRSEDEERGRLTFVIGKSKNMEEFKIRINNVGMVVVEKLLENTKYTSLEFGCMAGELMTETKKYLEQILIEPLKTIVSNLYFLRGFLILDAEETLPTLDSKEVITRYEADVREFLATPEPKKVFGTSSYSVAHTNYGILIIGKVSEEEEEIFLLFSFIKAIRSFLISLERFIDEIASGVYGDQTSERKNLVKRVLDHLSNSIHKTALSINNIKEKPLAKLLNLEEEYELIKTYSGDAPSQLEDVFPFKVRREHGMGLIKILQEEILRDGASYPTREYKRFEILRILAFSPSMSATELTEKLGYDRKKLGSTGFDNKARNVRKILEDLYDKGLADRVGENWAVKNEIRNLIRHPSFSKETNVYSEI